MESDPAPPKPKAKPGPKGPRTNRRHRTIWVSDQEYDAAMAAIKLARMKIITDTRKLGLTNAICTA